MPRTPRILPFLLAVAATWSCAPSDEYCEDIEHAAASVAAEAIYLDQPCETDDDCVVVGVNGTCFDTCHAVISVDNRDAFDAGLQQAEDEHCVDYGLCTLIVPPCAPINEGVCGNDGFCMEG